MPDVLAPCYYLAPDYGATDGPETMAIDPATLESIGPVGAAS